MHRSHFVFALAPIFLLACSSSGGSVGADNGDADTGNANGDETSTNGDSNVSNDDTGAPGDDTGTGGGGDTGTTPVDAGPIVESGNPGSADVTFTIDASKDVHPISPYVYGTNGIVDVGNVRETIARSGGNRLTAWNWENDESNAGSDYLFENDTYLTGNSSPKVMLTQAKSAGIAALMTIPILDYVAWKDSPANTDVRSTGSDYLTKLFRANKPAKGSAFTLTPDPNDANVYEDEFVNWVKNNAGSMVVYFDLDNEPDLWSGTHAEIYPKPVTYADLVARNVAFAKAAKAAWPEAKIDGSVNYGWEGYVSLQNAPDAGGRDWLEFYLAQMSAASKTAGIRLIDNLDVHWYVEQMRFDTGKNAPSCSGSKTLNTSSNDKDAATVAVRVQAPRSLYDASYSETSWIPCDGGSGPIDLIPRLMGKIAKNYPGTGLAISEWNYGGGTDASGAVATADALGAFGSGGLTLATYWPLSDQEPYAWGAFRAFRNYDGKGAAFGDTSIHASSSDLSLANVYASIDAANPKRVVIVAINRATSAKTAGISVAAAASFTKAKVYTITSAGPNPVAAADLTAVSTNAFNYSMPAMSVSVIVPE